MKIVDGPGHSEYGRSESVRDLNAMRDELAEIDKKIDAGEPFEPTKTPADTGGDDGGDEGKTDESTPDDQSTGDEPNDDDSAQVASLSDEDFKKLDEQYLDKLLAGTPNLQRYKTQGLKRILENYNNGVGFMDRVRVLANGFNVSTKDFIDHLERLAASDGGGAIDRRIERRDPAPAATISDEQIKAIADELAVKPETVKSMFDLMKASLGIQSVDERLRSIESEVGQTRQMSNQQRWEALWGSFSANESRKEIVKKLGGEKGDLGVAQEVLFAELQKLEEDNPGYCRKLLANGINPFERALKEIALNSKPELMMELLGAKPNKKQAPNIQIPNASADRSKNRSAQIKVTKDQLDSMSIEELEAAAERRAAR